jgi:glyoxylase I family protein
VFKLHALGLCCVALALGGCMSEAEKELPAAGSRPAATAPVAGASVWAVRYQVSDVARAVAFYTGKLGFVLDQQQGPAFARVSLGGVPVLLSGPGSSGARPMPDGRRQEPGGWNRIVVRVDDLPARIEEMRRAGVGFRNEMESGPGGRQIQVEDPDGNPVELFEPASSFRKGA